MELLGYIALFLLAISYAVSLTYVVRDTILLLVPAIMCRKVTGCKKDDCPFRSGCHHIAYSEKEQAKMRALINRLK